MPERDRTGESLLHKKMIFKSTLCVGALTFVLNSWLSRFQCEAATGIAPAKIHNGKCIINGSVIADGKSLELEKPCISYTCDVKAKTVEIVSCGKITASGNCTTVEGKGVYPNCCEQVVCTKSVPVPLNATALLSNSSSGC